MKTDRPIGYVWKSDLDLYQKKFPQLDWKPQKHISELYKLIQEEAQKEKSSIALICFPIVTVPVISQRGWLMSLENEFTELELSRYLSMGLRLLTEDGQLFGIPEDINLFGFFYHRLHKLKKLFKPPESWDELINTLSELRQNHNELGLQIELNTRYDNHALIWLLLHSNGVETRSLEFDYSFNKKKLDEVFQFMSVLKEQENAIPLSTLENYSKGSPREGRPESPLFYLGWLSNLTSSMRKSQETYLLSFPKGSAQGQTAFPVSGSAWTIPKKSQFKDIAIKTIKGIHESGFAKKNELQGNINLPSLKEFWEDKQILKRHPVLHSASILTDSGSCVTQKFFHSNIVSLASSIRKGLVDNLTSEQWTQRIQKSMPWENKEYKNSTVQKVISFIGERLGVLKNLDEVSAFAKLSSNHLNRLFKKELGCTCWDYVIQLRMERAKDLISTSQLSIKEISYQMGFKKASSFTRSFQKHFGVSPTSFRDEPFF
ncbi:MAG: hypothetical protein COA79_09635 [Planctomycetota bacterium]|nr:MAG: hypothetical protein COA79_09635 [Planctomycetota bacterium]